MSSDTRVSKYTVTSICERSLYVTKPATLHPFSSTHLAANQTSKTQNSFVTSTHTYRLLVFKERRFVWSEVRIIQSYSNTATTLFCHLLGAALLCAVERGAFYRVLNIRQTLIFCAFPACRYAFRAASGRCALYRPKHFGQGLSVDLFQKNHNSLKSIKPRLLVKLP